MGACSTVLVPLRGQREQLGVLQAFSTTAWAFTDHDIRCFDLFAELVLSALKPEDQDRRIHWLSDVADEVLQTKPAAAAPLAADAAIETLAMEPSRTSGSVSAAGGARSVAGTGDGASAVSTPEPAALEQPVVIPATVVELRESSVADPFEDETFEIQFASKQPALPAKSPHSLPFLHYLSLPGSSRPGLSVVIGLVTVAALFSAGAWWGMEVHGKTASAKVEAANTGISRQSVTAPPAPPADVLSPVSDNLMNPS